MQTFAMQFILLIFWSRKQAAVFPPNLIVFPSAPLASRCYSHGKQETDEEFDARWVTYFNKPDIDAWELRKGKTWPF